MKQALLTLFFALLTAVSALFTSHVSAQSRVPLAVWSFDGTEFPESTAVFPADCGRLAETSTLYFNGSYNSGYPYRLQFSTSQNENAHNPCTSANPEQSLQVKLQSSSTSGNIWICAYVLDFQNVGYQGLSLEYDLRVTAYGAKTYLLQYSLNGSSYTSFDTTFIDINDYDSFVHYTYDLNAISALQGAQRFYIRVLMQNATSANGTACFDNISFYGDRCVDTTMLSPVSGCAGYTWNGQALTQSGNYTQLIESEGLCDTVVVLPFTLLPTPDANIQTLDDNGDIKLYVDGGSDDYTYAWSANGTPCGSGQSIVANSKPTQDMTYCVTVTNSYGCSATSCTTIPANVGISDSEVQGIALFPNPAEKSVTISGKGMTAIALYNVQGQCVSNIEGITTDTFKADVSQLQKGIYMVSVRFEDGRKSVQKLIVR